MQLIQIWDLEEVNVSGCERDIGDTVVGKTIFQWESKKNKKNGEKDKKYQRPLTHTARNVSPYFVLKPDRAQSRFIFDDVISRCIQIADESINEIAYMRGLPLQLQHSHTVIIEGNCKALETSSPVTVRRSSLVHIMHNTVCV